MAAPTYSSRPDAFHPPVTWRIDGNELCREPDGKPVQRLPLSKVSAINLRRAPTRVANYRFACTLTFSDGPVRTARILNVHYAGFADLRDQSDSFNPFVVALHAALARLSPQAQASIGSSRPAYIAGLVFGWGAIAAFAALLLSWQELLHSRSVYKVLLALAIWSGFMIHFTLRNRPRDYLLNAIPDDILPSTSAQKR